MIKLKDLLNVILEDISDELVKLARTGSGLISPKGEPHSVPELGHIDFLVKQPKYKDFAIRLKQAGTHSDAWATLYRLILNDALENGWIRIISRGNEINVHGRRDLIKKRRKLINDIILFIESVKKKQMNVRWDFVK